MAGAHQHAAVARHQRKDVAGADDVVGALVGIDGHRHRARPVGGRDAGGHAFARLDRGGEGGLVAGLVVPGHQRQVEPLDPVLVHGEAHQAAAEADHEVDRLGRHLLGCDNQIAFILPVLVVRHDHHLSQAERPDAALDVIKDRFSFHSRPRKTKAPANT